ncbi:DUF1850 domain-containing protein [Brevibacillus brevis]|uniref:DUF1850 domain-containing protein n=1 Tax=Brevibacillus brevis TaxID=1393 RepID=UPI000D0E4C7F|nr:DUF1850 domain-containing protein [Brevibacillus brevis]PSJ66368.1 hypothetical protein C7J99_25935 [Brevibacillus brevis]RED21576.1 uncharacterized protein DUF1850 [Brevibacillus brevis]GEC91824.1 hypothetical protein BBR01nite_41550 [Brevibacillus brevis]VEF86750.1 Uncharacterized conserved protein [Brevibacillus brevis]
MQIWKKWRIRLLLVLTMGLMIIGPQPYLELRDFHRQERIGVVPVSLQDRFQIEWIHSVELTPWRETYRVVGFSGMELAETSFRSFGAGVPANFSDRPNVHVSIDGGWITVSGLQEQRDRVLYLITRSDYMLTVRDQKWPLASFMPLGTSLELSIRWFPWWFRYIYSLEKKERNA